MWAYRLTKNPKSDALFNFQSRLGKLVQLEKTFTRKVVRVNKVLAWARAHKDAIYYKNLVSLAKLNHFLYTKGGA